LILQDVVIGRECAEGEDGLFLKVSFFYDCQKEFFCNRIIESSMEMVEVEGGIAVFLSKHLGNGGILEPIVEDGPFVAKSDHGFSAFLTLLLERCGGCGLRGGVHYLCMFRTGYRLLFLLWDWGDRDW